MSVCWEGKSCSLSQDTTVHPWLQWSLISAGLHEAVEKQSEMLVCVVCPNSCLLGMQLCRGTGHRAPHLGMHRDPRGPQPGRWVSPAQLTQSQADLGRDPLKRPHSSLIALGTLSPVLRVGTEWAGTVLGPWEPVPKTWPCPLAPWEGKEHRPLLPQAVPPLPLTCYDLLPFTYVFLFFPFLLATTTAWSLAVNM